MNHLNLSDTEQRIQGFQSRIRVDYAAKIREVAKLTDEVAKWQTRLLDVEHENNVLRQQLVLAKKEFVELKKGTTVIITASKKVKPSRTAATSTSEIPKLSLKRERSPSLEIVDMPERSSKKLKGKERAERSLSVNSTADCQIIASVEPASQPLQSAQIPSMKAEAMIVNTTNATSYHYSESTNTTQFDSSQCRDRKNDIVNEEEISSSDSDSQNSNTSDSSDESDEEPDIEHASSSPNSATDKYLQSTAALAIHPPPLNLEVNRKFLRVSYGGNVDRKFLTYIPAERNPSGNFCRRVVFPTWGVSPSMPSRPGAPGLIFASRYQILPHLSCTLFCRNSTEWSKWCYLGEYEGEWVGNMSAEFFRKQSPKLQRKWALLVLRGKYVYEYLAMRARIALRLASVIPMGDKDEEERTIAREVASIEKGKGRPVSEDDIITAFSDGDEEIDIVRVKCVQYDHVFANDMKTRFLKLAQPERSESEETSTSSTTTPSSTTSVSEDKDNVHTLVTRFQRA